MKVVQLNQTASSHLLLTRVSYTLSNFISLTAQVRQRSYSHGGLINVNFKLANGSHLAKESTCSYLSDHVLTTGCYLHSVFSSVDVGELLVTVIAEPVHFSERVYLINAFWLKAFHIHSGVSSESFSLLVDEFSDPALIRR